MNKARLKASVQPSTMGSEKGRFLSATSMDADWKNWEMHPAGDEILVMVDGKATFDPGHEGMIWRSTATL